MSIGLLIIIILVLIVIVFICIKMISASLGVLSQKKKLIESSDGFFKDTVGTYTYEYVSKVFRNETQTYIKLIIYPTWNSDAFVNAPNNKWDKISVNIFNKYNGREQHEFFEFQPGLKFPPELTIVLNEGMFDGWKVNISLDVSSLWFVANKISQSNVRFDVVSE